MAFRQVTIIGTGLIGGSLGLALKKRHLAGRVVGCDRAPVLERAIECGAIESGSTHPADAVRGSDLVVLATPVIPILDLIDRLGPAIPPKTLVTDVGSTKAEVVERAAKSFGRNAGQRFLAGHPMAGKERGGAELADADLFRGAVWLFTDAPGCIRSKRALELIRDWREWVVAMGSKTIDLNPERHDELVAWVSHLPQFLATALSGLLEDEVGDAPELRDVGGRALREMTRLGSSPFSMWRDIAYTNTAAIEAALHALEQRLAHLRENLRTPELRDEFEKANRFRRE